ncbi:aldose 1-epimerase family protein [Nocardioides terrisoli]|uniref:aldose 1-epimerase family protein n=1 Tax=Nocardioides terrisoli TaxID=3388267 RepID=UPI00287B60C5|nr:aldose 1-epimerase family protein [Nocardioides marmorisolisilvae]
MSRSWTIGHGRYTATVLEAGGGLSSLRYDGSDLLDVPGEPVSGGRGQLLLPWPNRIRDGRYTFAGTERQLAISEPAFGNASHGLARWCAWTPVESAEDTIEVGMRLVAQSGYPWTLDLRARYALADDGLTVRLGATNRSDSPAPFAAGMHPYLRVGVVVDEAVLTVAADRHLRVDERHLPTTLEPTPAERDFSMGRRIGAVELDDAWTDLHRDERGWAQVRVEGAYVVRLDLGPQWRWVQVFTGDTLSEGRRQALAVEPMTAPADAFNSGTDLLVLAPGETWHGSFRLSREESPGR